MRDRSIDVGRGLLVILMVYCHVLQFFGAAQLFAIEHDLMNAINLTVFPSFVFYFGATAAMAYLSKSYLSALPGMVRTCLRAYAAFVLSGVGYRVLREGKPLAVGTARRVLQLTDIPGWSEFLIAFALYALLLIVGYAVFDWLSRKPFACLLTGALCVACCEFVPYGSVPTRLALLIGGRDFSYFPIVQYLPYFLAGMVYARGSRRTKAGLLVLAMLCSAAGAAYWKLFGFPNRFPPSWGWILLPGALVAGVVLVGRLICALPDFGVRAVEAVIRLPERLLAGLGGASLYMLLASNLVIFTLAGRGVVPVLSAKSVIPWSMPIQSPQGAAIWTAVLLIGLAFVAALAGRGGQKGRKSA